MSYGLGILFAFISALCWGGLSVARKSLGEEMRTLSGVAWSSSWQVPLVAALIGAGYARSGSGGDITQMLLPASTWPDADYWGWFAASLVINLVANWLMLRALQISPISLTTPYLAFTPIFTAILAIFVEDKMPNIWGWIGIVIVCGGAFFLNTAGDEDRSVLDAFKALEEERGSIYVLIVALLWSITPLLDKRATKVTDPIWHTGALAAGVGIFFMIWVLLEDRGARELVKEFRRVPWWTLLAALLTVAALALQLISYEGIEVSYMETVKRGVEVLVVMTAGYFIFDEQHIGKRLAVALVMIGGVALTLLAG